MILSLPKNTDRDTPLGRRKKINRSIVLCLVFLCLTIVASGTYAVFLPLRTSKPAESANLIGYWPFNEGSGTITLDVSNSNLAQINGATWTTGRFGNALSFNGSSDTVDINRPVVRTSASFTVAAWVLLSDLATGIPLSARMVIASAVSISSSQAPMSLLADSSPLA